MKKYLACLIVGSFFLASHVCSGSHREKDTLEEVKLERPSFKSAVGSLVKGVLCCTVVENLLESPFYEQNSGVFLPLVAVAGYSAGLHQLVSGGTELAYYVGSYGYTRYRKFQLYWNKPSEKSKQFPHQKKVNSQEVGSSKIREQYIVSLQRIRRQFVLYKDIASSSFYIAYETERLWRDGIFHAMMAGEENLLLIETLVSASLGCFFVLHNLNELYSYSVDKKKIPQGDPPFIGLMRGFFKTFLASRILAFEPDLEGEEPSCFYGMSQKQRAVLHDAVLFDGFYGITSNIWQAFINMKNFIRGKASVFIEDVSFQAENSPEQSPLFRKKKVEYPLVSSILKPQDTYGVKTSSQEFPGMKPSEKKDDAEPFTPKTKIKRRCVPNSPLLKDERPDKKQNAGVEISAEHIEMKRKLENILEHIGELEKFNTVKTKAIEKVLNKVCALVDAKTCPLDGSEYTIVFYKGTKKISIKYEAPHGVDSNVYKGYKLKRVLNAIETACMYFLDSRSIVEHMKRNNIYRFYTIPQNLLGNALLNRPDIF